MEHFNMHTRIPSGETCVTQNKQVLMFLLLSITMQCMVMEQFSTECCKTKTKPLSRQMDMHSYNTRNKDLIRLPRVKRNWGKQRLACHAVNDFNSLDTSIRKSSSLVIFKRNLLSSF